MGESMLQPEKYFKNNVGGSLTLLTAMANSGVICKIHNVDVITNGSPVGSPVVGGD